MSLIDLLMGGLNPCFCGRWSLSCKEIGAILIIAKVLILVFVEDGH